MKPVELARRASTRRCPSDKVPVAFVHSQQNGEIYESARLTEYAASALLCIQIGPWRFSPGVWKLAGTHRARRHASGAIHVKDLSKHPSLCASKAHWSAVARSASTRHHQASRASRDESVLSMHATVLRRGRRTRDTINSILCRQRRAAYDQQSGSVSCSSRLVQCSFLVQSRPLA